MDIKPLGPLGVSPASGYGHVVGTSARFFGEGLINPKYYFWNGFFQIRALKYQAGSFSKFVVGPIGSFLYGYDGEIEKLGDEQTLSTSISYIYIECDVDDGEVTMASIKAYGSRKSLFEPETDLTKQTKARHFLGMVKKSRPFYKFANNVISPVIQSSFAVPMLIPACVNGYRGVLITTT